MLRLKRRIASYMYMLQFLCFGNRKDFIRALFFLKKCWHSTCMRHRMDEDKVQH